MKKIGIFIVSLGFIISSSGLSYNGYNGNDYCEQLDVHIMNVRNQIQNKRIQLMQISRMQEFARHSNLQQEIIALSRREVALRNDRRRYCR